MGMLFAWATPEYLLDRMSLEQVVYYFNIGWEAKHTEAKVNWGTYGELLNENPKDKKSARNDVPTRQELEPLFKDPEYEFKDGAVWKGGKKVIYYRE
jgi:hypothetical protein